MKAVSLQVLLVLRLFSLVIPAAGQPKASLKCSRECSTFTQQKIPVNRIKSYYKTEPQCRKPAIILITRRSLEICADPDAGWVKQIKAKLDKEKATASPLPRDATPAAAPEAPGGFEKQVGLTQTVPTTVLQDTTISERIDDPAARTEVSDKSMQNTTQLTSASSEVTPEANRDSLKPPAPSAFAAGMVSSQPTLYSTALVHGFDTTVGPTEELAGRTATAATEVRVMTSPTAITKGSDHSVHPTNDRLNPTSAPGAASSGFNSDVPPTLDSTEIATATPVPPEATEASTLSSTNAREEGSSDHTIKAVSSSADAFGTKTFDYSSLVGKQEPSGLLTFTAPALSGQGRVQMITERPNNLPLPSSLSTPEMHLVIPVAVVGGLMVCTVAVVWLYLKFGIKTEDMSREMVQGLLYHKEAHPDNAYPMGIV